MSAVEEIQAAIEKLTKLKAESTPGPWFLTYEKSTHPRLWGNASENDADPVALAQNRGNAELIVLLHRTIDAQLAILNHDVALFTEFEEHGNARQWELAIERAGDLALARAINGDTQ